MRRYKNYYYSIRIAGYVSSKSIKRYWYTLYTINREQTICDFEDFLSWDDAAIAARTEIDNRNKKYKGSYFWL